MTSLAPRESEFTPGVDLFPSVSIDAEIAQVYGLLNIQVILVMNC